MLLVFCVLIVEEARVVVLLHVLLGRLVDIHVSHLLLGLLRLSCLLISSFFGFFCLFLGLNFLKLVKDVLVVKKGVRELVHEGVTLQEAVDTTLDDWDLEQLVNSRSLSWVSLEHH